MNGPVLIIEDNEQNRYLVAFLLERCGYRVVTAEDGERGIDAAREHLPSMILLDIQLPAMDGYAVARALRGIDALRGTPIVAVTAHAMTGDSERALAAGCDAYIEKPIDPERFVPSLRDLGLPPAGA
ncbi:MAG TPA: response regulator [Rudaea sp.]|nr:response regulator [Rudaea sp.]